jgi:tight adherence protein B
MLSPEILQTGALLLGALAIGGLAYALLFPYVSGDRQAEKRVQGVTDNKAARTARKAQGEQASSRRKSAVADTLKELEDRQKAKEKVSLRLRLERAGIDTTVNAFWIASAVSGLVCGAIMLVSMPTAPVLAAIAALFAGAFGLPRWVLNFLAKRRQKKFLDEFANAIDVVVRGVKSGLPLNECLNIIARESPQPICGEFQELVDQQRVGVPLSEGFERMMARMPLPEVKFFAIVVAIQQQAGGNLSEALGNLSGVLRDRRKLQAKVQAMSAEAKASAGVLGSLPFIVMLMVYLTTPNYISLLWTTKVGPFLLTCAGVWMTLGILVMKKMINFKY